jgi:ring-1,2-phenylacetyl-CoA epoxidase subunit PaaE
MAFGLFKKKKKNESTADNRFQKLKIREVRPVAKDAVNVIFEKPGEEWTYKPGQFITLVDQVNGEKLRRAYSLCTTPYLDEYPAVTVKRVEGGRMSNHVNDNFVAGSEVEVMEPMGMFTTEYDPSKARKAVFFGGGSGITPLYAIIRSILHQEPDSEVLLVYGNRSEEYIIFKDELKELANKYSNFSVKHILEDDANGVADYKGRPSTQSIDDMCKELGVDSSYEVYICGPQPMMDVVQGGLKSAGIPEENVRLESFEAGKTSPREIFEADDTGDGSASATIILDDEEFEITVEKGRPVLEQGLEQGLDMPYSCQSGLCTACRGKCIEGEITTDKAEGLSQDELEEGYVLLCVGLAKSDKVKVEIG